MTMPNGTASFAAFREVVLDDFHLMMRLRRSLEREAYVAEVVAAGAERGFAFDADAVRAALRRGEATWRAPEDEPSPSATPWLRLEHRTE